MTPGITTWEELGRLNGPVLLIANSRERDECAAAAVAEVLGRTTTGALHVIAEVSWREWLLEHGVPAASIMPAKDHAGSPLEVNYFLETSPALHWIASKRFQVFVGSSPHNLYNEEVKAVFERRVAPLVGAEARLLAHTLPKRYVYVLDLPSLLERIGRDPKIAQYQMVTRSIITDLFALWKANGESSRTDCGSFDEVLSVLEAHLGASLLNYDEHSPIPIRVASVTSPLAEMVSELHERFVDLADRYGRRTSAVALEDEAITLLRRVKRRLMGDPSARK